jgi:hypothetical protein
MLNQKKAIIMNITNNVSITISAEAMQKIAEGFSTIVTNMPKLVTLTPEQRQTLPKMGDKTIAFVNKAIEYARQNPKIVPAYLNMEEFARDVDAVNKLFQVTTPIQKLAEEIDDTMMMAGCEAYAAALAFYTSLKAALTAGETGLKSAYEDMAARFPGRKVKKPEESKQV